MRGSVNGSGAAVPRRATPIPDGSKDSVRMVENGRRYGGNGRRAASRESRTRIVPIHRRLLSGSGLSADVAPASWARRRSHPVVAGRLGRPSDRRRRLLERLRQHWGNRFDLRRSRRKSPELRCDRHAGRRARPACRAPGNRSSSDTAAGLDPAGTPPSRRGAPRRIPWAPRTSISVLCLCTISAAAVPDTQMCVDMGQHAPPIRRPADPGQGEPIFLTSLGGG